MLEVELLDVERSGLGWLNSCHNLPGPPRPAGGQRAITTRREYDTLEYTRQRNGTE